MTVGSPVAPCVYGVMKGSVRHCPNQISLQVKVHRRNQFEPTLLTFTAAFCFEILTLSRASGGERLNFNLLGLFVKEKAQRKT